MVGPVSRSSVLSLIGLATTPAMLAIILFAGGLGGAAFHPPAAALAHRLGGSRPGLAMSVHITGGTLGFSMGPLLFAPFARALRPRVDAAAGAARPARHRPVPAARAGLSTAPGQRSSFASLRPYARPLGLLYLIVVLRTLTALSFATFIPVMLTRRGMSVARGRSAVGALPVRERRGRVLRWSGRRSVRAAPGDCLVARAVDAVPGGGAARHRLAVHRAAGHRRDVPAVDAAGQRRVRAGPRAGQRRHGVLPDDGVRLGHRRA